MVSFMRWVLITHFLIFAVAPLWAASEVVTSIDKNPIVTGDSFILTVSIDDDIDADVLNPEQWLGSEFEVLNLRTSRRTSMVNNSFSRTTNFTISVRAPRQVGTYQIPSLTIAGVSSDPIEMRVLAVSQSSETEAQRDAFIRTSLSADSVYVQEQVTLVARLYLANNLQSGNMTAPSLADADIAQLGKDEETYEVIDGKRYQVFQRTYLITPQRSGLMQIRSPVFSGQISGDDTTSIFSTFAAQAVTTASQDIELEVKPIPTDWQGDWLPAELVTLSAEIVSEDETVPTQIIQGQPLTISYRLTALGSKPEQLPNVQLTDLDGANVYPEQPQSSSMLRNGQLISQKVLNVTVIPRTTGSLTIPSISLPWFNTAINRRAVTSTEAITFEVLPAQGLQPQLPEPMQANADSSRTDTSAAPETSVAAATTKSESQANTSQWWWPYLTVGLGLLWLVTVVLWWYNSRRPKRAAPVMSSAATASAAWQQLQTGCQKNDAELTIQALQRWARTDLGLTQATLQDLQDYYDDAPLRSQISYLMACRYGDKALPWQEGKALLRALKAARKKHGDPRQTASVLPELYPSK